MMTILGDEMLILLSLDHLLKLKSTREEMLTIYSAVTVAGICNSVGGGVFDMPPPCRWPISVGVKARVVNWKQVDVAVSRSFRLSWNALIAHSTSTVGGALSEIVVTVSLSTVPRLSLLSGQSCRLRVGKRTFVCHFVTD